MQDKNQNELDEDDYYRDSCFLCKDSLAQDSSIVISHGKRWHYRCDQKLRELMPNYELLKDDEFFTRLQEVAEFNHGRTDEPR